MHIPDGFLDAKTAVASAGLAVAGVGMALREVKRNLPPRRVPLLGLSAAFLFAAQMINFPVAAGTSGHLMGGALVTALLGPAAAVVVVTAVLIVQSLLFGDGGVMALGANIFNLAILGCGGAFLVFRAARRLMPGPRGEISALAFAAWCSVMFAAISCAGQLAWSRTVSWDAALAAMAGTHLVIGLAEGLISALVFQFVIRTRPQVVVQDPNGGVSRDVLLFGGLVTLGLIVFVAPFASPWPDGLEAVAARLGFEHRATSAMASPIPDYAMPGIPGTTGATVLAGTLGASAVFVLSLFLGRLLVPATAGSKTK